jgi:hypothetical protein
MQQMGLDAEQSPGQLPDQASEVLPVPTKILAWLLRRIISQVNLP